MLRPGQAGGCHPAEPHLLNPDAWILNLACAAQEKQTVEFDNPRVLITDAKIETIKEIIPVLEQVTRLNQPLLIIAEDVTGGVPVYPLKRTKITKLGCRFLFIFLHVPAQPAAFQLALHPYKMSGCFRQCLVRAWSWCALSCALCTAVC